MFGFGMRANRLCKRYNVNHGKIIIIIIFISSIEHSIVVHGAVQYNYKKIVKLKSRIKNIIILY